MRLIPGSGTRVMQGSAQWRRCALRDTMSVDDVVTLEVQAPVSPPPDASGDFSGGFAGLAFDARCRLFHAQPEDGKVEFVLWGHTTAIGVHDDTAHPFEITAAGTEVAGVPRGTL